ncbi:MAG: serine hydrolase [Henriciella sp.]|jgi:CubicO group peptidase (beta-lactamase class C family)|nr:serine hydrolase [Henriciella sp.]
MKSFLIGLVALIIGAVLGVFAFTQIVPLPNDVFARAAAFDGDKDYFFQNASEVYPTRTVARSVVSQPLPVSEGALSGFTFEHEGATKTLADMYTDMETSGMVILHRGQVVHESYGRGADVGTRFTTWSLVKSITSTLVGAAIADGKIKSVDDKLETYLPEVKGTDYEGVTIKQALQMSSGIRYDPKLFEGDMSDTVHVMTNSVVTGKKTAFELALKFKRENEPGTDFNYNTAESQVLIELVRRATGMDAADYLEQKIWRPLGMEHDAGWIIDNPGPNGAEVGGAMFNSALRDWARFGLFIEQGGNWNGEQILPVDWVDRATVSDEPHIMPGEVHPNKNRGYAWHWWTYADGTFTASGANGQSLYIDRQNDIVVARSSAWPAGYVREYDDQTFAMYKALEAWFDTGPVEILAAPE